APDNSAERGVGAEGKLSSTACADCPRAPSDTHSRMMSRSICFILNPLRFSMGNNRRANEPRVVRKARDSKGNEPARVTFVRIYCDRIFHPLLKNKSPAFLRGFFAPKARLPERPVLVHAFHAAAVAACRGRGLGLRNFGDHGFGGQHQSGDGCRVL